MPLTPEGPSQSRRIAKIEERLRRLETRRSLPNSSVGSGGLTVEDGGQINVNPNGSAIELGVFTDTNPSTGLPLEHAAMRFVSVQPGMDTCSLGAVENFDGLPPMLWARGATWSGLDCSAIMGLGTVQLLADSRVQVKAPWLDVDDADGNVATVTGKQVGVALAAGPQAVWAVPDTVSEWHAVDGVGGISAYIPVRASSFPVGSSREVKEDIGPITFDAIEVIRHAAALRWRYRASFATEDIEHIGPMAEDLPDQLVHVADGVKSVDLLTLVGVLWEAVSTLSARVEELEAAV